MFVLFLRSGVSVTLCRANAGGEVPAIPCQRVWASSLKRFGESRCDHRCCDASAGTGDFQRQTNGLSTRAATAQRRLCRWYAPSHIGTRTALTPTTSVPGLGHLYHSHQRRDSAHPAHTHLRGDLRYLQRGWAHPAHICRDWRPLPTALPHLRRDSAAVRSGRDRRQLVHGKRSSDLLAMRRLPRRVPVRNRCVTYAHKPRQALSDACIDRKPVWAS